MSAGKVSRAASPVSSPASNVVKLPTASPRKVQQRYNQRLRDYRAANPWPGEYIYPGVRAAMETAERLREVRQSLTPAMELVTAILWALDDETRDKVKMALVPGVAVGRETAAQAFAVFRSTRMTFGEEIDLLNAMKRI